MQVVFFRHGIAIDREDPHCPPDPERFLTPKGVDRTRQAALGLKALGVTPGVILTSPWLRARQTATLAAECLGVGERHVKQTPVLLFHAAPEELWRELARLKNDCVLCAGHAPHLDNAIAHALGAPRPVTALKKAGAACVDHDPAHPGNGQLLWLLTPKQLRRLGQI